MFLLFISAWLLPPAHAIDQNDFQSCFESSLTVYRTLQYDEIQHMSDTESLK